MSTKIRATKQMVIDAAIDCLGQKFTNAGDPIAASDLATKKYVDAARMGMDWQNSVLDKDLTVAPASPVNGARYLIYGNPTGTWAGRVGCIAEWDANASTWLYGIPNKGFTILVEDEGIQYNYNGSAWVNIFTGLQAHDLVSTSHTASGLAIGNFLRATGATTFAFGSASASDVSAVPNTATINGKTVTSNPTLTIASADFANQGSSVNYLLHGNPSGDPSWSALAAADIAAKLITYAKIQDVVNNNCVLGRVNGANGVIEEILTTGTGNVARAISPTFTGTITASAITGSTYNALTLAAQATGFTIGGGTTSKTLTMDTDVTISNLAPKANATMTGTTACATLTASTVNALTLTSQATGYTIAGGTTPCTLTVNTSVSTSALAPLLSPSFTTPSLGVATATSINSVSMATQTGKFTVSGGVTTSKTLTVDTDITISDLAPKVSPSFTTPTLGVASATSINTLQFAAQTASFTIIGGTTTPKTLTVDSTVTTSTLAPIASPTFTGTLTTPAITISGGGALNGLVLASAANGFTIAGGTASKILTVDATVSISNLAPLASPSFTTPTLGVASATSINKVIITAPATSATLTIADGKTLTVNNSLSLTATSAGYSLNLTNNADVRGTNTGDQTLTGLLPTQTGNGGAFLTTDGTSASWALITAKKVTRHPLTGARDNVNVTFTSTAGVPIVAGTEELFINGLLQNSGIAGGNDYDINYTSGVVTLAAALKDTNDVILMNYWKV